MSGVASTAALPPEVPREIATREDGSLEISLAWRQSDDAVFLHVLDAKSGDSALVKLTNRAEALRAFHKPAGYLARNFGNRRLRRALKHCSDPHG